MTASARVSYNSLLFTIILLLLVDSTALTLKGRDKSSLPLSNNDKQVVEKQLGYLPNNFVCVSARNRKEVPIAIKTYPLDGGAPRRQQKSTDGLPDGSSLGTPFPTLYWLTCPDISRAIGDLERQGLVKVLDEWLADDDEARRKLHLAHLDYAKTRWESLTLQDRSILLERDEPSFHRIRSMMQDSGIAGTNITSYSTGGQPSTKCLHAHYAHFRSDPQQLNPVGQVVHEKLLCIDDLVL